jgi:Kef-type K+ transport system membrane component KefB/nucleotide-binding universal stress UspA family protein
MSIFSQIAFPLKEPISILLLIFSIILVTPRLLKKISVPGIVGFIIAGVLIGPNGFNIIDKSSGIDLFTQFGLLYIMFLVGLEFDLIDFKKHRKDSFTFGALTFFIPLLIGLPVCYYLLHLNFISSLLLSSMFSTHTLISYPIASRLGITKNRAINIVIGGTIITDTAVLLLLAIIENSLFSNLDFTFWFKMISSLVLFTIIILWIIPIFSRWVFRNIKGGEGSTQYIFVIFILFLSAFLAQVAGIEPMIGAFMAGIALNRLIPGSSSLMRRTVFIGNTIFIPFFLIGVGMIVDLKILLNGLDALYISLILVVTALITKFLAAWLTQHLFKYTRNERNIIFGLSSSHAAATIALVLVGYKIGLFNIDILNGTVLVIFFSCLFSSFVTENAGRKLAIIESQKGIDINSIPQKILVPIANPANVIPLIDFAMLIKDRSSEEPIYPLNVVIDNDDASTELINKSKLYNDLIKQSSGGESQTRLITRVDLDVANGVIRACKDLMMTKIVIGWTGKLTTSNYIFGSLLESILNKTSQSLFIVRTINPINTYRHIHIIVPPNAEYEPNFDMWLRTCVLLSKQLSTNINIYGNSVSISNFKSHCQIQKYPSHIVFNEFNNFEDLSAISSKMNRFDLMLIVSARKMTISYSNFMETYTKQFVKYFENVSFILIYPNQMTFDNENVTSIRLGGHNNLFLHTNIKLYKKVFKSIKEFIRGDN